MGRLLPEYRFADPTKKWTNALVTVRGRPHSAALGALVAEAMRSKWRDRPALAIEEMPEIADDVPLDGDPSAP